MRKLTLLVRNNIGLHARPAAELVRIAQQFQSRITVEKGSVKANGKSLVNILSLGAGGGDEIVVTADGADEAEALNAIEELFEKTLSDE